MSRVRDYGAFAAGFVLMAAAPRLVDGGVAIGILAGAMLTTLMIVVSRCFPSADTTDHPPHPDTPSERGNVMTDNEIATEARRIAHEHSSACKNRPAIYASRGHGNACNRLYQEIKAAMRRAAGRPS